MEGQSGAQDPRFSGKGNPYELVVDKEIISKNRPRNSALCTQVCVSLAVSLMQLLAGVVFGYTGVVLPSLTDSNSQDIYLTPKQVSLFTSTLMVGIILGTFIISPFSIKFGQRLTLLFFVPLGLIGWLINYFSKAFWLLLLSRFLLGVFALACFACSQSFVTEIVHCKLRGKFMAFGDLCKLIGFLFAYLVGSSNLDWRTAGLVGGLTPALIPCLVLLVVPNSPRWTAVKGRPKEEVIKSLRYFRDDNQDIDAEYKEIKEDVLRMKNSSTTLQQLKYLKEKSTLRIMCFLLYMNIGFPLSGNTIVIVYCASIFQSSEIDLNVYASTILIGIVRVVSTIAYICIADSFGRRPIFMIFCSLATLSMGALGLFFYLKHIGYDTSPIYWLPLTSLICFATFTNTYSPVVEVSRSELLPNSVRSLGVSLLISFYNIGSFVTVLTYPIIADSIGLHWAFWICTMNSLAMLVVMYFFLPETKGKSLEEIAKLF